MLSSSALLNNIEDMFTDIHGVVAMATVSPLAGM